MTHKISALKETAMVRPPIFRLPPEMHLAITGHLMFYDVYALRLCNSYLHSVIPPIKIERLDLEGEEGEYQCVNDAQHAEAEASYLARSHELYACAQCGHMYRRRHRNFQCPNLAPVITWRRCKGCEPQTEDCGGVDYPCPHDDIEEDGYEPVDKWDRRYQYFQVEDEEIDETTTPSLHEEVV